MLLDHLRARTRSLHEALERDSGMAVLLRDDLTETAYAALLARLHGFYAPLDAALAPHYAALGLAPADRAGRLARDLDALGAPLRPGTPETSAAAAPSAFASEGEALGALYVVEGAALGGHVIARHVGRTLGLTPARGLAFFSSDGAHVGARWKAFVAHLDASDASPTAVVAGATSTFHAFARCLN